MTIIQSDGLYGFQPCFLKPKSADKDCLCAFSAVSAEGIGYLAKMLEVKVTTLATVIEIILLSCSTLWVLKSLYYYYYVIISI